MFKHIEPRTLDLLRGQRTHHCRLVNDRSAPYIHHHCGWFHGREFLIAEHVVGLGRERQRDHQIESVGERLRDMMPFLNPVKVSDIEAPAKKEEPAVATTA